MACHRRLRSHQCICIHLQLLWQVVAFRCNERSICLACLLRRHPHYRPRQGSHTSICQIRFRNLHQHYWMGSVGYRLHRRPHQHKLGFRLLRLCYAYCRRSASTRKDDTSCNYGDGWYWIRHVVVLLCQHDVQFERSGSGVCDADIRTSS